MGFLMYLILLIPSLTWKLILKLNGRSIWLISEGRNKASDNGYYLFKYIRENHPNDSVYYAINKKCSDYKKVSKLGNIINYGSIKHYMYYLVSINISTEDIASPDNVFFTILHRYLNLYNNRVFLQRGITKDDIKSLHYNKTKFRLFVCGASKEYEYIKNHYGYPNNYVKYLGLPRFDNYNDATINNKLILVMPTYRKHISKNITNTLFYKRWNSLLNNNELINFIEENNIMIYFYLHKNMHKYLNKFYTSSKNIKIIKDEDITNIIKESSLLVTDYSSVYMDFAYMSKPVIYYQFDYKDYRKSGYREGYFKYSKDAFGKIILDEEDLIKKIIAYITMDYKQEKVYNDRVDEFFKDRDSSNSKRVYEAIKELRD